ncbi:hypothetical protein AAVH_11998 [Aphelenchoides avenae]|nr:hypothetical protein AAVH_11998 [Aphelenchus avenae]
MSYDIWLGNYIAEQKAKVEKLRETQHPLELTISDPHSPACGRKRSCDSIIVVDDDDDLSVKRPKPNTTSNVHGTASASLQNAPVGLPTLPSCPIAAPPSQPTRGAFSTPACSSVSQPTVALAGNQQHSVKGQCYVTLPTIPPVRIMVPEDSPLAQQFKVSNEMENLMRMRRDSLYRRQLASEAEAKPTVFDRLESQTLRRPKPITPMMGTSEINPSATIMTPHLRLPFVSNGLLPVMHLPETSLSFTGTLEPTSATSSAAINDRLYGYLLHELARSLPPHAQMTQLVNLAPLSNSPALTSAFQASKLHLPLEASKSDGISLVEATMTDVNGIAASTCPQLVHSLRQQQPQNGLSQRHCPLVL